METNKISFVLRWGNIALLILMVALTFFITATTDPATKQATLASFFGTIAFFLAALGMMIFSIIRVFKKYHRARSWVWILIIPILTILLFFAWLPPRAERTNDSRINSTREDVPCPFTAIEREYEDLSSQRESYVEETNYRDFKVTGTAKEQVKNEIKGCIPNEIREKAKLAGVTDAYGMAHPAVGYYFETEMQGSECKPTWVAVHLYADIYLPKLTTSNSGLQSEWDKFIKNLRVHEDGHRDISSEGAKKIKDALMAMAAPDCDMLKKKMEQKVDELIEEIRRKNDVYDRQTDHGATQGAEF